MKTSPWILSFAVACLAGAGCDDASSAEPGPDGGVAVPEVPAEVALDALCALAAEVQCAGALGCCAADAPFASAEECTAATSTCELSLSRVTDSAFFADGAIVYEGADAAEALRAIAASTAECGIAAQSFGLEQVFVGQLGEGGDCTPEAGGDAHRLACAPGLTCRVLEDEEAGAIAGTCRRPSTSDDEEQEAEPAPSLEARYCTAPEPLTPPANSTIRPTALSLNTRDVSNAGTGEDVTLHFIQAGETTEYFCTLEGGIGRDETLICTDLRTRTWSNASSSSLFYVEMNGTDGLAVDSVAVCLADDGEACTSTHSAFTGGTFDNGDDDMLKSRVTWAFGVFDDGFRYFWVDGNSNGDCNMAKIKFDDDNKVTCSSHGSH